MVSRTSVKFHPANMNDSLCSYFIISILLILIKSPTSVCTTDPRYDSCDNAFLCGTFRSLKYPFWGKDRPSYCGKLDYKLDCVNDSIPIIAIKSVTYRVLDVSYHDNTIILTRMDYWGELCPSILVNTTIASTSFNYTVGTRNITLGYGCDLPQLQAPALEYPCTINNTESNLVYAPNTPCNKSVVVPVFELSERDLNENKTDLVAALDKGFALQWYLESDECRKCMMSHGSCGIDLDNHFTCYCSNVANTCRKQTGSKGSAWKLIIGISCGIAGFLIMLFVILCRKKRVWETLAGDLRLPGMSHFLRGTGRNHQIEIFIRNYTTMAPFRFKYSEIKKMTNSFNEKLGQGGYGSVYKGQLPNGQLVAVKILGKTCGDGQDFINEVASIGRTSHVNVVTLLGFCFDGKKRALIYELMPNGSLDKFLRSDGSRLGWETLFQIAKGIARGLEYLHQDCNTRIVHFDIKPHNILLDGEFIPKISDFGLAKLCNRKDSIVSVTGARGTAGYMAPELYFRSFGGASHKSDVYSYGMMVLEMTGSHKKSNLNTTSMSETYFPDCIYKKVESGENLGVDGVTTKEEEELARKMVMVSLWCIQSDPLNRPCISKVVEMLEGSFQSLQIPPRRFWSSPTRDEQIDSPSATQTLSKKQVQQIQAT